MRKIFTMGLGYFLFSMASQSAHAGANISFRFGSHQSTCAPICWSPYSPCRPDFHDHHCREPEPVVVVVQQPPRIQTTYVVRESVDYQSRIDWGRVIVIPRSQPQPIVVPSEPARQETTTYYRLGHDWAHDLRNDVTTWNQFVAYVKANNLKASQGNYDEFRKGFISAYGINAEAALDKALQ